MPNPPQKPRPTPDVRFVFHPEQDAMYVHFEHADNTFDSAANRLGRLNAWWLSEAALLAYWKPAEALERFKAAGLQADAMEAGGLDAYVAWTYAFVSSRFAALNPIQVRRARRCAPAAGAVGARAGSRSSRIQGRARSRLGRYERPAGRALRLAQCVVQRAQPGGGARNTGGRALSEHERRPHTGIAEGR